VFGRGGEECEYLASAGIPFEVVPGITAAFGAPATAGIPLTHREMSRSFVLVTGHVGPDDPQHLDFAALAKMETIAFYMGLKYLAYNCRQLIEAGMNPATPAAVIQWGTRPQQRTVVGTLEDIADRVTREQLPPPALVLVGEVVNLRRKIEWFERLPLHGQRIVVTRCLDQAAALSKPLAAAGAEVILAPTLIIAPVDDRRPLDSALQNIRQYDWLLLTSANGVDALFDCLRSSNKDARALSGPKIAAIGTATAGRLANFGIRADLIPPEAVGESMAEALITAGVRGQRILLLRGDLARPQLPTALHAAGAIVEDVIVYRTICPTSLPPSFLSRLADHTLDWITFTSPSSFDNLLTLLGTEKTKLLKTIKLASIGPVTTQTIRSGGFEVAAEAQPHDVSGLVSAISKHR
jgi:uroporphyrinogen III methyltransferase/synthase